MEQLSSTKKIKELTDQQREQLGLLDIDETEGDDGTSKKPDGDEKIDIVTTPEAWKFGVLVVDEAHTCKNSRSTTHQLIRSINRECLLLSSATPLMNHPRDMLGYLRLGFYNLPIVLPLPQHYDALTMYKEDFDPYVPVGATPYQNLDGIDRVGSVTNNALIRDTQGANVTAQELELCDAFEQDGYKWWTLSPELFRHVARQHSWSFDLCKTIIGQIYEQLFLCRNMSTSIKTPDGKSISPGDDLLGAKFITTHVNLSPEHQGICRMGKKNITGMSAEKKARYTAEAAAERQEKKLLLAERLAVAAEAQVAATEQVAAGINAVGTVLRDFLESYQAAVSYTPLFHLLTLETNPLTYKHSSLCWLK
ncbi:hypothetical protein GQX73_g9387 [Xylaria multiplex]|uniref:Helicase ATP-binding domain-containing protein n=1 Tax=Xylaria multiplex TaxID=323545 RepID=A0A7C8MGS5_9PEZI|nr:hypothetical protein GQX73_g9387 [Xylaria multiplex]